MRTLFLSIAVVALAACGSDGSDGDGDVSAAPNADEINGFALTLAEDTAPDGTVTYSTLSVNDTETDTITVTERGTDDQGVPFDRTILVTRYDALGRKIDEDTIAPDGTIATRFVYEYDEAGRLSRIVGTGDDTASESLYEYDEADRLSTRTFRRTRPDVAATVFVRTYEDGRLASTRARDSGAFGDGIQTRRYEHDAAGRMTARFDDDGDDGSVDVTRRITYDADGNVASIERFDADGTMTTTTSYSYEAVDEPIYNFPLRLLTTLF